MANPEHLKILETGVKAWNEWRLKNPGVVPDLKEIKLFSADLKRIDLRGAELKDALLFGVDLSDAILSEAKLDGATLTEIALCRANLTGASLIHANLMGTDLSEANLREAICPLTIFLNAKFRNADLRKACFAGSNFTDADLRGADLRQAVLEEANLIRARLAKADLADADLTAATLNGTDFSHANLNGCRVYGVSVWDVKLDGASQLELIITPQSEPKLQVDNLEVAQFLYLILNNQKIRDVIDTITSKVVLILGRFEPSRKRILDAMRDALRKRNYLPVVFDFERPVSRDLTETVRTLAHLSRFVIADITDPRSIPHELQAIVPDLAVPVQTLLLESQRPYGMFDDFRGKYSWVLEPYYYEDETTLLAQLDNKVILPAEQKLIEMRK